MKSKRAIACAIAFACCFVLGCYKPLEIRQHRGQQQPTSAISLDDYLGPEASRVFTRTSESGTAEYPQKFDEGRRLDGRMVGQNLAEISEYIAGRTEEWPRVEDGGEVFFFEFDPPLTEWPRQIGGVSPHWVSSVLCYNLGGGEPFKTGTAERVVWLQNRGETTAGGVDYPDCLVLGSRTRFNLGSSTLMIDETAWMARGKGLVRRTETITGGNVIKVTATYHYELVEYTRTGDERSDRRLRSAALHLDSKMPPKIGGAIVEWPKEE